MDNVLDLTRLIENLRAAEHDQQLPPSDVNRYLLNQIYWPLMEGQDIELKEIQFDRFEQDDIYPILCWHEKREYAVEYAEHFHDHVRKTAPTSTRTRRFC